VCVTCTVAQVGCEAFLDRRWSVFRGLGVEEIFGLGRHWSSALSEALKTRCLLENTFNVLHPSSCTKPPTYTVSKLEETSKLANNNYLLTQQYRTERSSLRLYDMTKHLTCHPPPKKSLPHPSSLFTTTMRIRFLFAESPPRKGTP